MYFFSLISYNKILYLLMTTNVVLIENEQQNSKELSVKKCFGSSCKRSEEILKAGICFHSLS